MPEDYGKSPRLLANEVFPASADQPEREYMPEFELSEPITFFLGRNGSGKSRAAKIIASKTEAQYLSTDRLTGLMGFSVYQWGADQVEFRGLPLDDGLQSTALRRSSESGTAIYQLYGLRDHPEVWLRVAAFMKRVLGRTLEMREVAGFLDPHVQIGTGFYSLLRDEGHGLRELTILLAATYRRDCRLLVVDEPELHLHPAMIDLWAGELRAECEATGKRAIVVTHEPLLAQAVSVERLDSYWYFAPGANPQNVGKAILNAQRASADGALYRNPDLLSDLVFSPRPVLVEGPHDVAALDAVLRRTQPAAVVAQTKLVSCGGNGGVATWFEIAKKLGIDVRAVADLDSVFSSELPRVMDRDATVTEGYRLDLIANPPKTSKVLKPLYVSLREAKIAADPKSRAAWLAGLPTDDGNAVRKAKLLELWKRAGLLLHSQGTLEAVLNIEIKSVESARTAAQSPGALDQVGEWCSFSLDLASDVEALLNLTVERIASSIQQALRLSPDSQFERPIGQLADSDSTLVTVAPLGQGKHRITVKSPAEFENYFVEFSRDTAPSSLILRPAS